MMGKKTSHSGADLSTLPASEAPSFINYPKQLNYYVPVNHLEGISGRPLT